MVSKVAYIFPGYLEHDAKHKYSETKRLLELKGYRVVFWNISWKKQSLSSMVNRFTGQYGIATDGDVLLLGHSLGAMLALVLAEKMRAKILVLASLSPYFREDLDARMLDSEDLTLGVRRLHDFRRYSLKDIITRVEGYTYLLCGEKEYNDVRATFYNATDLIVRGKAIEVAGTGHGIDQNAYPAALEQVLSRI